MNWRSEEGERPNASKVSAISENSRAWTTGTGCEQVGLWAASALARRPLEPAGRRRGPLPRSHERAMSPVVSPISLKKRSSSVRGADSEAMTGPRCTKKGTNSCSASLIEGPRPANESPTPSSVLWLLSRTSSWNMLKKSSSSTGALGVLQRDGRSRAEGLRARAGGDLDVLQAEHRARPHDDLAVERQLLDRLVELHARHRGGPGVAAAVHHLLGADAVDHADAEAADAHLVALDQVRCRRGASR